MNRAWWTIIISIILIIAGCGLLLGYRRMTSTNADELCDDWDIYTGQFGSYSEGDVIKIIDEINDIKHLSVHPMTGEPISWTQMTFKSVDLELSDLTGVITDPSKIWGYMVFNGDLTDLYKKGDRVEVMVQVTTISLMGQELEILDWAEEQMKASLYPNRLNVDTFAALNLGDRNDIAHANMNFEILFVVIVIAGVVLLIVSVLKVRRARVPSDRYENLTVDRGYVKGTGVKDTHRHYDYDSTLLPPPPPPPPEHEPYSSTEPVRTSYVHPSAQASGDGAKEDVTFKPVGKPVQGDYFENLGSVRPISKSELQELRGSQVTKQVDDETRDDSSDVVFKTVSRPMSHKQYISTIETKSVSDKSLKRPVKSSYIGRTRTRPTKLRKMKEIDWSAQRTGGFGEGGDTATEVAPLEVRRSGGAPSGTTRVIQCPKCGNVMRLTVPYRPFESYCDKCGARGVIE